MFDAIVIGGGLVGVSVAYHLVARGAKALLLDRHDAGRATDAGAGILSPETTSDDTDTWFNFAIKAVGYYPTLLDQLRAHNADETGYSRCGQLKVAVSEDEIEPFEKALQMIFDRQKRRGKPSANDLYLISAEEAREMFPPLAHVHRALYYRGAARVDGRLLAKALRQAAEQRGLTVKQFSCDRLIIDGQKVLGVVANGKTFNADTIAIAGGAWSVAFGQQLGLEIPVAPQRGQIIHLKLPDMDTANWPIVNPFRGHYILTWPDHRVVAGATRETGSGFNPQNTVGGVQEVLSEAVRVAPGLRHAQIHEIRTGLRPYTVDGLPVVGAVPGFNNIYLATGHGPTGLQLGPYTGYLVADLMLGRETKTDISAFDVTRF